LKCLFIIIIINSNNFVTSATLANYVGAHSVILV